MHSDDESTNTLYIPVNIKTRFEFIDGFGFKELSITALVSAISLIFAILLSNLTGDGTKGVLLVLITATATGMAVRKNDSNISIIDILKLFITFTTTQQTFKYSYHDIYREKKE